MRCRRGAGVWHGGSPAVAIPRRRPRLPGQIQPAFEHEVGGGLELPARDGRPDQRAAPVRVHLDRLRALHAARAPQPARARGPLVVGGCEGQGVRPALWQHQEGRDGRGQGQRCGGDAGPVPVARRHGAGQEPGREAGQGGCTCRLHCGAWVGQQQGRAGPAAREIWRGPAACLAMSAGRGPGQGHSARGLRAVVPVVPGEIDSVHERDWADWPQPGFHLWQGSQGRGVSDHAAAFLCLRRAWRSRTTNWRRTSRARR